MRRQAAPGADADNGRGVAEIERHELGVQVVAVGATVAFAAIATFIIVKLVDYVLGLRVEPEAEQLGLDLAVHGEVAYQS